NDQPMTLLARRPITDTLTYEATSSVAHEIPRRMPPCGVGRGAEITQTGHGSSLSRASSDMAQNGTSSSVPSAPCDPAGAPASGLPGAGRSAPYPRPEPRKRPAP